MKKPRRKSRRKPEQLRKPISKPFRWVTSNGEVLEVKSMETGHLFNSLRMVYNNMGNSYSYFYRIEGGHKYDDIQRWPKKLVNQTLEVLIEELDTRKDLNPWQRKQVQAMMVYSTMKVYEN